MAEPKEPGLTFLGKFAVFLFILGCLAGAWYLWARDNPIARQATGQTAAPSTPVTTSSGGSAEKVRFGLAYGTEKERWLKWAVEEFAKTEDGKNIQIELIPKGSIEGAQAVLDEDKRIQAWTPASTLYREVFAQNFRDKFGHEPFVRQEMTALTPMVFVMWEERYAAFVAKYQNVSWKTIGLALNEPGGWNAIAAHPEWGVFKFGHTHPQESNSGLAALLLMASAYYDKSSDVTMKELLSPEFQAWMGGIERRVSSSMSSTGKLMQDMVRKGPSTYDGLFVYENVAIDYFKSGQNNWGTLHLSYPAYNAWNDNPYFVLDVPWSSPEQRAAAGKFVDFLLSEPAQKQAVQVHGLRPGNTSVGVKFPGSPFVEYAKYGLSDNLGQIVQNPKEDVINNLLQIWQRNRAP